MIAALLRLGCGRHPHRVAATRFIEAEPVRPARHTHHLHRTVPGGELWQERTAFRDAPRRGPALLQRYAALEVELLDRGGGLPYAGAGIALRDDRHVRS